MFNDFELSPSFFTGLNSNSPSLIHGPDQKKLKIFQLFIIQPATSPDQSEPNISTDGACADFVPIRCLFSGEEISLKLN
jgi:hypothetical protein